MIKNIDIEKFGLFDNYLWNPNVGGDNLFKKLNIIYGRNYSGKTTLSRIFRCAEKGELHKYYTDGKFTIRCENAHTISHNNLQYLHQIRVYNEDFVKENLSWLYKEDGSIEPFAILGSKNIELENEIKKIEDLLGSIIDKKGLLFESFEENNVLKKQQDLLNEKEQSLEAKLKAKANDKIKIDSNLFTITNEKKTYIITDIKKDIEKVRNDLGKYILPLNDIESKRKQLSEEAKNNIAKITEAKPNFEKFYAKTKDLLSRIIKPNQPLTDLLNDSLLQTWVREGIEKHKDKRDRCGFCNSPLPQALWTKLDAHFSKESEDLRREILNEINILEGAKQRLNSFQMPKKEDFYSSFYPEFDSFQAKWIITTDNYSKNIDALKSGLSKREQDVFKVVDLEEIQDISSEILALIKEINYLIDENNLKTGNLTKELPKIRNDLRYSEVANFVNAIGFFEQETKIKELKKEVEKLARKQTDKQNQINELHNQKRKLETQTKDESRGAELVNQHLSHSFGHDELKLIPVGDAPNLKFKITRDNVEVNNLSQGECSLIAFCYFIAKIEDELTNDKLIIYIDDPISSLDNNHIFFMFSLIESVLAKPKKYAQLFISTHNLDFLKHLKGLTKPENDGIGHFLIERRQKQNDKKSFVIPMPSHFRDYVTEFNYLFSEIYKIYNQVPNNQEDRIRNSYNQFYNLPNNMRKFLEYYLFYKFPNNKKPLDNLDKLFDNNVPSLINRVINEYSHLTYVDRGWKPIDVNEAVDCVKTIMDKIKEKDPEQFEALVQSIR
jgi:wobble nucleotide-excising tRNase